MNGEGDGVNVSGGSCKLQMKHSVTQKVRPAEEELHPGLNKSQAALRSARRLI